MVAKTLDDDQKGINIIDTPYGSTKFLCVAESGLYSLILQAEAKGKPVVKQFKDWVTKEVLPSIRKTGSFVTGQPSLVENYKTRAAIADISGQNLISPVAMVVAAPATAANCLTNSQIDLQPIDAGTSISPSPSEAKGPWVRYLRSLRGMVQPFCSSHFTGKPLIGMLSDWMGLP